jgi:hypothetical protein
MVSFSLSTPWRWRFYIFFLFVFYFVQLIFYDFSLCGQNDFIKYSIVVDNFNPFCIRQTHRTQYFVESLSLHYFTHVINYYIQLLFFEFLQFFHYIYLFIFILCMYLISISIYMRVYYIYSIWSVTYKYFGLFHY